jgi:hypothetical protein
MAVYIVAYRINAAATDSGQTLEAIKKLGIGWMHYIPNSVLLYSNDSAETIGKNIFKLMTKDDYVIVIRITKDYYGWLPQRAWDWLNKDVSYD